MKRFYYYLTTDERTGDLMREVLTVDETIARIQPLRHEPILFRIAPDWEALAGNWMTEWKRTGDTRYRDYILAGMKSLAALPGGIDAHNAFRYDLKTKQMTDIGEPNQKGGYFMYLFGGDELGYELNQLIDYPPFAQAWNKMAEKVARSTPAVASYYAPRITAYVACAEHDADLGHKAWDELRRFLATRDVRDRFPEHPAQINDTRVPTPVEEIPVLDTPGTSQWALNLIEVPELARDYYTPPGASLELSCRQSADPDWRRTDSFRSGRENAEAGGSGIGGGGDLGGSSPDHRINLLAPKEFLTILKS